MMKKILSILVCMAFAQVMFAQTLKIGDDAPAIAYSKWLKGTPINEFKDDQIYVLEFWATWCGPCRAAMPHLSELAKKYESKARFIGVNVLENTDGKPYETSLPAVTDFVNSSENTMEYDVIVDNNATDMNKNWLKAAGILGIPSTFVVHKGKIVWIGHPMKLDPVMENVLAATYDINVYKNEFVTATNRVADALEAWSKMEKQLKEAKSAKNYERALEILDSCASKPKSSFMLGFLKFELLLDHFSEKEAMTFLNGYGRNNPYLPLSVPELISKKDSLSIATYNYALEKLMAQNPMSSKNANLIAMAMKKTGMIEQAIAFQQKAIDLAKDELGNPKFKNITQQTISSYQQSLKMYKKIKLN